MLGLFGHVMKRYDAVTKVTMEIYVEENNGDKDRKRDKCRIM